MVQLHHLPLILNYNYPFKSDLITRSRVPKGTKAKMNKGKLWDTKEEIKLLQELENGYDILSIAEIHQRTSGGISARINEIAYKMYKQNMDIDFISKKTKLNENLINSLIKKRETFVSKGDEIEELKKLVNTLIENQTKLISILSSLNLKIY
jgi:hypothetical protein